MHYDVTLTQVALFPPKALSRTKYEGMGGRTIGAKNRPIPNRESTIFSEESTFVPLNLSRNRAC